MTHSCHHSPYFDRCKHLHGQQVLASPDVAANSVVILDHCTRAAKDGIPDSLFHHQVASMKQVNPVISPLIWDCMMNPKDIWAVTYDLVCNSPTRPDALSAPTFVDAVNGVVSELSELQKLSMVVLIRGHGGGDYHDFVYGHSNCKVYYLFSFSLFSLHQLDF